MKRLPHLMAAALAACAPADAPAGEDAAPATDSILDEAFRQRRSDLQVAGEGRVIRVLPDDTRGSRHQRFLLELSTGQTLLVAHNIDTAARVPVEVGDRVGFHGEYEWNPQGGVLHWTHRDDNGGHPHGWLEHGGRRYD